MERSDAILERLTTLHPKEIDLSLGRVERLMADLGHPERRLAPVIHIAGTNGKGSTTAFMRAMLEAAGKRVHVYTSPHLVRFHERIRLGDPSGSHFVDEDELVDALNRVEKINADRPITQFEITTAAAFEIFARHPADIVLLEVGLGGRLDATNVIASPLAAVVTAVSLDHEKFLGATITAIAHEKAGILKRGRPGVIAPQNDEALAEIEREGATRRADLFIANRDWVARPEGGRLVYEDDQGLVDLPAPRLPGRHQYANAGTAVAALRRAGLRLPTSAFEVGLATVEWPARLQSLVGGTLFTSIPDAEVWLDGGHNPAAGHVIAEAMADLEERDPKPLVLIAGMLNTKDPVGFFRPFAGLAQRVYTVPVPASAASRDPRDLGAAAEAAGLDATPMPDVPSSITAIAGARHASAPRVLICGSLYLAGTVLALNGTPPK